MPNWNYSLDPPYYPLDRDDEQTSGPSPEDKDQRDDWKDDAKHCDND